jgi:hypothetical protein
MFKCLFFLPCFADSDWLEPKEGFWPHQHGRTVRPYEVAYRHTENNYF